MGKTKRKIVECPRCDEADYRGLGVNVCGLCECQFWVTQDGKAIPHSFTPHVREDEIQNAGSGPVISDEADIRWAVNVLLEQIAEKFETHETLDIWRSEAASIVRSFKHDLPVIPKDRQEST